MSSPLTTKKEKPAASKMPSMTPSTVSSMSTSTSTSTSESTSESTTPDSDHFEEEKKFDDDTDDTSMNIAIETSKRQYTKREPNQQPTRKSKRARKSTTIQVDGHTVLTKNNYSLKGHEYIFHKVNVNVNTGNDKKSNIKKKESTSKAPKKASEAQIKNQQRIQRRMAFNEKIKTQMKIDEKHKWKLVSCYQNLLLPFVTDKVQIRLSQFAHARDGVSDGGNGNGNTGNGTNDTNDATMSNIGSKLMTQQKINVQPDIVDTKLRDYQMIGLEWMMNMHKNGLNMILGDEMGLGKTLQTISLIAHLKEHSNIQSPSLVICPLSVLYSWCNEISKHAPTLKYFRLHSSDSKERHHQKQTMLKSITNYDIIVTTYEMVKNTQIRSLISTTYFHYVVLDEGHIIKDNTTFVSNAVRKIHSRYRLLLTGTPLQNNLVELYSILNYLYDDLFTEDLFFRDAFDISKNTIDRDMLLKANKLLNLFMLRRLKIEVEKLMPKKIETKILCPLSTAQIFWYKGHLMKDINVLIKASDDYTNGNDNTNTNESKYKVISNLIMQLRKCCLHPFLFPGGEANVEETSLEELIASSGKLAVLDKMLRSMYQNKNRTVIFSQFTSMLDILEDYCTMRGWKFCRFDGSTPRAQRNYKINQFNAPDSEYFIFLMSTRSGGLGINLQTADTCILYDSDWNPQPDIQAMARVHRIGQKKVVHVYRLVSSGTVEERVLERAEKKLYLDQMVNRGTSSQTADEHELEGTRLTTSELLSTLKFGSNAIFASKNDLPTDKDIDAVIDRERSEQSSSGLLQGGATKTANDFDIDKELTDTQTFGGIDFRQIRDKMDKEKKGKGPKNLKEEWKDLNMLADSNGGRGMRTKKNRLLNIEDCNGTSRQVLSVNNYDLVEGEPSVFNKETRKTSGMSNPKREKVEITYTHQDFCQYCGDGGKLILCPLCPISVHAECHGMTVGNFFTMPHHRTCPHHRCLVCDKSVVGAGGMLFACECCPACYCEDCLPSETVNYLGETTERLEKLRYDGNPRIIYIHCSEHCVGVAKHDFDWKEPSIEKRWCPEEINVSYAFGSNALSVKDIAKKFAQRREIDTESLHPN